MIKNMSQNVTVMIYTDVHTSGKSNLLILDGNLDQQQFRAILYTAI
jgi:hypothetical protein